MDFRPLGWFSRWSYSNSVGICPILIQAPDMMKLFRRYGTICNWQDHFPSPRGTELADRANRFSRFFDLPVSFTSTDSSGEPSYVFGFDYRGKRFFWEFRKSGLRLTAMADTGVELVVDVVNWFFDRMLAPIVKAVEERRATAT